MIKNLQQFAMLFLLFLSVSCAVDKVEKDEVQTTNPDNVWLYDGDNTVLKNVIEDLKNSEYRESLERRLAKNEVLWQEAKFLLIDNKKRILVPFLSTDKENVIGVLALVKDDKGKTSFDMTSRTQLNSKNNKLPFWNRGTWMGYFMALDATVLGIKNGNPGLAQLEGSDEKLTKMFGTSTAKSLKTCRQQYTGYYATFYYVEATCPEGSESTNCGVITEVVFVPVYEEICWEDGQPAPTLPDPPALPDPVIPANPGALAYRNINFTQTGFLGYVNSETYSIGSALITNNGDVCISTVRIATPVFTLDLKIEQLINRNPAIPYYYMYGVTPVFTDNAPEWGSGSTYGSADHWMDGQNNYFENTTSIVEYEGRHRYVVAGNGGPLLFSIPIKYKIEINSHTGEILSITRIDL